MPNLKKKYPGKKAIEDGKFTIHDFDSNVLNKPAKIQMGCFSPKMKFKKNRIKLLKDFSVNEMNDETRNNKSIIDVNETITLPQLNNLSNPNKNNSLTDLILPKTKRFVTISFNQLMMKNLYTDVEFKKNLKNTKFNYISLNEMKKKLLF